MKKYIFYFLILFFIGINSFAQDNSHVKIGNEIKFNQGLFKVGVYISEISTDFSIFISNEGNCGFELIEYINISKNFKPLINYSLYSDFENSTLEKICVGFAHNLMLDNKEFFLNYIFNIGYANNYIETNKSTVKYLSFINYIKIPLKNKNTYIMINNGFEILDNKTFLSNGFSFLFCNL